MHGRVLFVPINKRNSLRRRATPLEPKKESEEGGPLKHGRRAGGRGGRVGRGARGGDQRGAGGRAGGPDRADTGAFSLRRRETRERQVHERCERSWWWWWWGSHPCPLAVAAPAPPPPNPDEAAPCTRSRTRRRQCARRRRRCVGARRTPLAPARLIHSFAVSRESLPPPLLSVHSPLSLSIFRRFCFFALFVSLPLFPSLPPSGSVKPLQ